MWEVFMPSPRGRLSTRKFMTLATTLLVAVFGYIFATAPVAYAADATWSDDTTITHNGQDHVTTLVPYTSATTPRLPNLPDNSIYFSYLNPAGNRASVIYFDESMAGTYLDQTQAQLITYDVTKDASGKPVFSNPSKKIISIEPRAPPATTAASSSGSCTVEGGLGWIVCPITNTLANAMDYIYDKVASFLKVQPLLVTSKSSMYQVWDISKNIANIAFIIGFLVIIYAQITGAVMSNYTLKKLLPRLIISVILVNVSYYVCAVAIDLSNILGYAVQDLFISIRNSLTIQGSVTWDPINAAEIAALATGAGIGGVVAGTALTAAVVGGGAIFLFLPMLIALFFVVLVSFLILAARQAIITILVVMAPLAFVAYLLPNTEKWFEKWRSALFTLLIMFPAFSVVFGGSQLAASLIIGSNLQGNGDFIMIVLAWGVQLAPLAITPLLLKLGGGVLNRFAGIINNPGKGVFDRGKNWAKERGDAAVARGNRRLAASQNLNTLPRFGARRMTYNRMYGKQRLEGEKSANEALTKGYFSQTAAGTDIHRLNERAKMEQGYGDHRNQASWENEVRTNQYLRDRAIQSHDYHTRAELYKGDVDSEGEEHWQHTLQHDAQLRGIKTDTHLRKGRATVTEEALTNADEVVLQAQIAGTPNLRALKIQGSVDTKTADLYKKQVESDAALQYQQIIDGTPYMRALKRQTHLNEGEAKIIDEQLTAADESFFQNQVQYDQNGMRQRKVETIISTEKANLYKGVVEARGQQEYADMLRTGSLQNILSQTVEYQKRGESAKAIAQKTAEARFDVRSLNDQAIRELRLKETSATDSAEQAKEGLENLIDNIRATGSGTQVAGLSAADLAIADDIRAISRERELQDQVKTSAQIKKSSNFVNDLKADTAAGQALRDRAAGVDDVYGADRVLATAKAADTKEMMTNIDNFQNTMQYELASDNKYLVDSFNASAEDDIVHRVAYARLLNKNGSDGVTRLRELLAQTTRGQTPDSPEMLNLKELLGAEESFRRNGRDFEVWANNERDDNGNLYADFEAVTKSHKTWSDITAHRFASMAKPAQKFALKELQRMDQASGTNYLGGLISRIMTDTTAQGNIKGVPLEMIAKLNPNPPQPGQPQGRLDADLTND